MADKPVDHTTADGVAVITVDYPPVNAIGADVLAGLEAAVTQLEVDFSARVVVITGAGDKVFMAGADISEFEQLIADPTGMHDRMAWSRSIFDRIAALRQPVIAAVQATAVGGGCEVAMLCDLIVADERARFGLSEVRIGLIPGGGGTQRLARRVPVGVALELLMLGGQVSAAEALRIGLVNRVVPAGTALDASLELAGKLAALPAVAVQEAKQAVREGVELPLKEAIDCERQHFLRTFASNDFKEGYTAFLEKRQPAFTHT
jgi:enoyl-CoA hydratase/carnithine racemase